MRELSLLDLYCGGGGCSVGYNRAGFKVVGVDSSPQPNYPFEFIQCDVLSLDIEYLKQFDAIHASPPCQHASTIAKQQRKLRPDKYNHPDLIEPTRAMLIASGKPYIMENVEGSELIGPAILCGSFFGLDVRRHRLFETSFGLMDTPCSHHWQTPRFRSLDKRKKGLSCVVGVHGHENYKGERVLREKAMEIDWMTPQELTQAIPPAYTEWIGTQLISILGNNS